MKANAVTVHRLIQGSKVFLIPTFQRRYTWRKEQWEQLWNDLLVEYGMDHPEDPDALYGHFLGSVVLHPAAGPASTLMRHQVIDGQQRLTTILVLLAALRDERRELEPEWNPSAIDEQYLSNPFSKEFPERLVPTKLDREAYDETVRNRRPTGDIGIAYNFFRKIIRGAVADDGVDIQKLENTLLLNMLLVEITTKTGDSVNSIFNTLNSKGMDLSAADLVRNEILHHVGAVLADSAHENLWIPMEIRLVKQGAKSPDREFVTFLWAREVAINPKTSRDELFSVFENRLRLRMQGRGPDERHAIAFSSLQEMYDDHLLFAIVRDPALAVQDDRIEPVLAEALAQLKAWQSEPTTPVALWLLKYAVENGSDQADAALAIEIMLSYLVKRILNGVPTNQLNRLLTPVAHELATRNNGQTVSSRMQEILSRPAYYWPTDEQVLASVLGNPIYASARRYVKFLLSVVEQSLPGFERADLTRSQIEHVVPQVLSDEWKSALFDAGYEESQAEALVHTLGNLTLTESNQRMGNATFPRKREEFFEHSALRLNRELSRLDQFLPPQIESRSLELARILLSRFPHGPSGSRATEEFGRSGASTAARLESLLQTLPVRRWVTETDLVAVLGAESTELRSIVQDLDATLARLIRDPARNIPAWFNVELRREVEDQDRAQFDLADRMQNPELTEYISHIDANDDEMSASEDSGDGEG